MKLPIEGSQWEHFKGGIYRIVGHSWDAEGPDQVCLIVHYQKWTDHNAPIFSRSLWNFLGPVTTPEGDQRAAARFTVRIP